MTQATRVLLIGELPEMVDFSDPALPPGLNADKIRAGIEIAMRGLRDRGFESDVAYTTTAEAAGAEVAAALGSKTYDCVVIGAGLRVLPKMTPVFEAVMNAVHKHAPQAKLAFNISPEDSVAAAERQLR